MLVNTSQYLVIVRVSWLVLCGMMLFSRFVFQAFGATWMRSFLDKWKYSRTHRIWGWIAFIFGLAVCGEILFLWSELNWIDRFLTFLLIVILCADGLLNLFPAWFGHFKEKMQDAWVKKRRSTNKASDKYLFGTVNFFLGLSAFLVGTIVYSYKPMELFWLSISAIVAIILMTMLIIACKLETSQNT